MVICASYNLQLLFTAKFSGVRSPVSVARRDQIRNHPADISLLGGVVIRPRMVSGYRHRPCLVTVVKVHEELRCVIDVLSRVKHGLYRGKILSVKVLVDLHAADVDKLRATPPRSNESIDGLALTIEEHCLAFHVHRERLKRSLASRFRQPN